MKTTPALVAAALALVATSSVAAGKSCDALKAEIAARLEAKKLTGYSLDVVDAARAGDAKGVGTCERGARKITYAKK